MFKILLALIVTLAINVAMGNSFIAFASKTATKLFNSGSGLKGWNLMKNPWNNKGSGYSYAERDEKGVRGLVPAGEPLDLETKVELSMIQLRKKATPIDKYIFLHTIQDTDETLYYAILAKHTAETMPLVYTPTVGQACQEWSHIYRNTPRGLYVSIKDLGRVEDILNNYPNKDIKVIVFTDGERILGLGDLGMNGMGIPNGKLALYTTCAGINPENCLPVTIDVGTNTESILNDKFYLGLRQKRDRSEKYDQLIEEFFTAAQKLYGRNVLVQFEDFGNTNAFRLLERYRNRATTFNDDIQGTASVVLAGLFASTSLTGKKLSDNKFLFFGAGEAGIGIADLISSAVAREAGISIEEAKKKCYFVDSKGLVCSDRNTDGKLEHHKIPYAHNLKETFGYNGNFPTSLAEAVDLIKPSALIGVSAQGSTFTKEVVEKMTTNNAHPIIFALSNPTHKAECTAKEAYTWSNGKCVFASGSPFDPVTHNGKTYTPGQGNNAYIFPAVGLAAVISKAQTISDDDFLVAARALADLVPKERLDAGCCYPDIANIRVVSQQIAAAVAKYVYESGRSALKPEDLGANANVKDVKWWFEFAAKQMYVPGYKK